MIREVTLPNLCVSTDQRILYRKVGKSSNKKCKCGLCSTKDLKIKALVKRLNNLEEKLKKRQQHKIEEMTDQLKSLREKNRFNENKINLMKENITEYERVIKENKARIALYNTKREKKKGSKKFTSTETKEEINRASLEEEETELLRNIKSSKKTKEDLEKFENAVHLITRDENNEESEYLKKLLLRETFLRDYTFYNNPKLCSYFLLITKMVQNDDPNSRNNDEIIKKKLILFNTPKYPKGNEEVFSVLPKIRKGKPTSQNKITILLVIVDEEKDQEIDSDSLGSFFWLGQEQRIVYFNVRKQKLEISGNLESLKELRSFFGEKELDLLPNIHEQVKFGSSISTPSPSQLKRRKKKSKSKKKRIKSDVEILFGDQFPVLLKNKNKKLRRRKRKKESDKKKKIEPIAAPIAAPIVIPSAWNDPRNSKLVMDEEKTKD